MKNNYEKLINKLDELLTVDGTGPSVSPNSSGSGRLPLPGIFITREMNVEKLDKNQLLFVHVMLHKFYATGKNKYMTTDDIEYLHGKVKGKIKHVRFDKLDEK